MKLKNIFTGIEKGLDFIDKARKILTSVEIVGRHARAMVDELKELWPHNEEDQETEIEENEQSQH